MLFFAYPVLLVVLSPGVDGLTVERGVYLALLSLVAGAISGAFIWATITQPLIKWKQGKNW